MLVLSRRLKQSIIIADEVRVTVLRITPNRIELGVEAESHIPVDREEIYLRKQAAARVATRGDGKVRSSGAASTVVVSLRKPVSRMRKAIAIQQCDEQ
jgi:carbon storage regulator